MTDEELKRKIKAFLTAASIQCDIALECIDENRWESLWSLLLAADKQLARACELLEIERITRYPV